ncbi:hypothetical protein AB1Y20_003503 [Prymnesium parvum]|uniref:Uncharacterized protein n=1 Tax=Prymnesium parvum TaxID=97485 RepID=A0AB34JC02_PRYPA|eukprot:CAMPEP_0113254084 /NCGR_PEP_ID=MMETSP0008_2-20120614/13519_1 /TAXON_ID=97485 /ORGANISM="Prymnesium parvum" /LENGTH=141 /DNA_ID=CAMNT_0000102291 /DNA_START=1 /DNA_END=426 /DNA_ORIENTATION=+ /assembly_acc=CAM_ASM_000153
MRSVLLLLLPSLGAAFMLPAPPRTPATLGSAPRAAVYADELAAPTENATSSAEAGGPEMVNLDEGQFMRWYRAQKLKEKFEEENPVDPLERIKGPAFSLFFILLGFNLGPIIGKIFEITGVSRESLVLPAIELPFLGGGGS